MNVPRSLQMKFAFLVFIMMVAVVLSGAVSASLVLSEQNYTSAYVVESSYSFTGPASIQDAVDNYETNDGDHIMLEPGNHDEQIVLDKNLTLTGITSPESTVIQCSSDDSATITIAQGRAVVLENITVWNYGSGQPIINNGQITIINCLVNGNYIENEVWECVAGGEDTIETMTLPIEGEGASFTGSAVDTSTGDTPTGDTSTEMDQTLSGTTTTENMGSLDSDDTESNEDPAVNDPAVNDPDPGIPLGSLASGMLMLMGGTVISGRKQD